MKTPECWKPFSDRIITPVGGFEANPPRTGQWFYFKGDHVRGPVTLTWIIQSLGKSVPLKSIVSSYGSDPWMTIDQMILYSGYACREDVIQLQSQPLEWYFCYPHLSEEGPFALCQIQAFYELDIIDAETLVAHVASKSLGWLRMQVLINAGYFSKSQDSQ